jgi:sugar/nucleoside kinase (ribokinase family)
MKYDLLGIGNALVDIEVCVDDEFIARNSLTKGGMTLFTVDKQKKILDKLHSLSTKVSSGGSAANTIHGLSVLGGNTCYIGSVANDVYGKHYAEDMQSCGVGFSGATNVPSDTGTCVILVTPDSERTMLTHLGASSLLHPDNINEKIIDNCGMIYIEGYLWTGDDTRNAAEKLAKIAKKNKIPVAFTLSDAFVVSSFKKQLTEFIQKNVDILFCNDVEAKAMVGTENMQKAFDGLKKISQTIFITRGANGSWACRHNQDKVSVKVFPTKAIDTTGAGDLFAAGALYGIIRNYDLKSSAILGSYCASEVVSHMGGRMPINSEVDAEKILSKYEKF